MSWYPFDVVAEKLEALGLAKKRHVNKLSARCPAHDDHNPSLEVTRNDDGSASITCFAGCTLKALVQALGLTRADFVPDAISSPRSTAAVRRSEMRGGTDFPTPDAAKAAILRTLREEGGGYEATGEWIYHDAGGSEFMRVLRFDDRSVAKKTCRPIHPTESGRWKIGAPGGKLPIYRLPDLEAAEADARIWVVEGEKCAEVGRELGALTTTSALGASSASRSDWTHLAGRRVAIFPDNDEPGRKYASDVASTLLEQDSGADVRVVDLPGLDHGGDIADFVRIRADAGAAPDAIRLELEALIESSPTLARTPDRDLSTCPPSRARRSPKTLRLDDAALHGIAGEWVRLVEPHTEADPAALLFQFLVAFGNVVGRGPHVRIESDEHHGNLFAVVVGRSSKGRKGTSWGYVRKLFEAIDPVWSGKRTASGLSSGEGLIHALRDIEGADDDVPKDKRLLVFEGEFASPLRVLQRDGNTLSATVRSAWDGGPLQVLTKHSPMVAIGAHISIIGHSTSPEVQRYLDRTELANGFANRMLWVYVGRSKKLPFGGRVPEAELKRIVERLRLIVAAAQQVGRVEFDEQGRKDWEIAYDVLSEERPGMLGSVTGRAEAQVLRLALLYALLDEARQIRREHLAAAIACWRYADDSARIIFGDSTGNTDADRILRALREKEAGLDRTEISNALGRNVDRVRLDAALDLLLEFGLATCWHEKTYGRPREVFEATKETKELLDATEAPDLSSSISYSRSTELAPAGLAAAPPLNEAAARSPSQSWLTLAAIAGADRSRLSREAVQEAAPSAEATDSGGKRNADGAPRAGAASRCQPSRKARRET